MTNIKMINKKEMKINENKYNKSINTMIMKTMEIDLNLFHVMTTDDDKNTVKRW